MAGHETDGRLGGEFFTPGTSSFTEFLTAHRPELLPTRSPLPPGVRAGVRQHRAVVSAFYSSNVEVYLNREKLAVFCRNLAMLPYNWQTWFIGSKGMQRFPAKLKAC